MDYIEIIDKYINYLNSCTDLSVTLHPLCGEGIISNIRLIKYNIHTNPFCIFVKSCENAWNMCVDSHKKVMEKCKCGSFFGVCRYGVAEYVYPISQNGEIMGFVSVSGYRVQNEKTKRNITRLAKQYKIDFKKINKLHINYLNPDIPPKQKIDTLINPLIAMFELAYIKCDVNPDRADIKYLLYKRARDFINLNHNSYISSSDICRELACSRSYLSHIFKKYNGRSINEYLTFLRMQDAEQLLISTTMSVTDIAMAIGFSNSNYFSAVFTKFYKICPREYKKIHATQEK